MHILYLYIFSLLYYLTDHHFTNFCKSPLIFIYQVAYFLMYHGLDTTGSGNIQKMFASKTVIERARYFYDRKLTCVTDFN